MIKLPKIIILFLFIFCHACSVPEPVANQNQTNNTENPNPSEKTNIAPKITLQTDAKTGKLLHCQANLNQQSGEKLQHILSQILDAPTCYINPISSEADENNAHTWLNDENFYQLITEILSIKGLTLAINEKYMIKGLVQAQLINEPPSNQTLMIITVEDDDELLKLRKILQPTLNDLNNIQIYITPNKKISQYINEQNANVSKRLQNEQATLAEMQQALNIQVINFGLGSHALPPFNIEVLKKLANWLQKNPSIQLQITGFTDNTGDENYNLQLSKMRANTIQQFLIDNGVDSQRIQTLGKGSSNPIADNDSEMGRFKNRRIEFLLTQLPAVNINTP